MSDMANEELRVLLEGVQVNVGGSGAAVWGGITGTLANQTDLKDALDAKYEKPAAGVPASDMSEAVQESLEKADTALQEHQDISGKVDKIEGKGLSSNDYTNEDKAKVQDALTSEDLSGYATQQWIEAQGYLTEHQDISGKQDELISGTNIKTINGQSVLGSGNIEIQGGGTYTLPTASASTKGGVMIGDGLTMTGDVLSADVKSDDIPTDLADLQGDSTHRTVTDAEKTAWDNKSSFSGSYNDLTNKPTIPSKVSDLTDDVHIVDEQMLEQELQDVQQWVEGQNYLTSVKSVNGTAMSGSGNIDTHPAIESSSVSIFEDALEANKFYQLGTLSEFYLNTETPSTTHLDEFMFEFASGSTPTDFSWDVTNITLWDDTFSIEANKTYQGSVVNGICIMIGV